VYTVRLPLTGDGRALISGQVLDGMTPQSQPVPGKNDPMMPVVWTRTYKGADGRSGRVLTTTMGSSVDLNSVGVRRFLVNGVYWCLGLDKPRVPSDVDIVGEYKPTPFGFGQHQKGLRPADFKMPPQTQAR
jgi:hypothetical protein